MDGSGHLDLGEIEAAVSDCIHDKDTRCAMIEAIKEFKESNLNLAVAKRYPVLLILDEVSKENSLFLLKSFLCLWDTSRPLLLKFRVCLVGKTRLEENEAM